MNLHALAAPFISLVNPMLPVTLRISSGSVTNPDGSRTPVYLPPRNVLGQVQALAFRELYQLDGLNLNGTKRAIYLLGDVEGVVRPFGKGGDLITFPDGTVWLTVLDLENWGRTGTSDAWVKVAVVLQMDGSVR